MTYWLASANRDNWEIIKKQKVWGVPKRNKNTISRVNIGDKIVIYVSQKKMDDVILPSAITGAYEITSKFYEDNSKIFIAPSQMTAEIFPYRVRLKPIQIFSEPLDFKPLIPQLRFITNKTMWTGHIRTAMREIHKEDYELIIHKGSKD